MGMKKILFTIIYVVSVSNFLFGQSDSLDIRLDTLKWISYEYLDSAKGTYVEHDSYFITYGEEKIEWFQNEGNLVTSFAVNQTSGSWTDTSTSGMLTYHVTHNQIAGKIIVQRDGDWITIKLNFEGMRAGNWNYVFTISTFENL